MVIPEGTQTGKKFRLRGKGAPSLRGGAVDDQYVTVNVVTPTGLNDTKAALKEFAAAGDLKVNPKKKRLLTIKDAFEGDIKKKSHRALFFTHPQAPVFLLSQLV